MFSSAFKSKKPVLERLLCRSTARPLSLLVWVVVVSSTDRDAGAAELKASRASRIVIQPSSASLAGGHARLSTTALERKGANYIGNYQLKVTPYSFKSESGTLSVAVSDASLSKLATGLPMNFVGTAVTDATGEERAIMVKASPTGIGLQKGTITISIATKNGELRFNSSYALGGT